MCGPLFCCEKKQSCCIIFHIFLHWSYLLQLDEISSLLIYYSITVFKKKNCSAHENRTVVFPTIRNGGPRCAREECDPSRFRETAQFSDTTYVEIITI